MKDVSLRKTLWKQPDKVWLNKLWYIHRVRYYSYKKRMRKISLYWYEQISRVNWLKKAKWGTKGAIQCLFFKGIRMYICIYWYFCKCTGKENKNPTRNGCHKGYEGTGIETGVGAKLYVFLCSLVFELCKHITQ